MTGSRALVGGLLATLLPVVGCTPPADPPTEPGSDSASASVPASVSPRGLPRIEEYVALGDSYTAAPGVPPADRTGDGCFRSDANYPELVAAALVPARFVDVSCSGAQTADARQVQRTFAGQVRPQLAALTTRTDLVTVGLGGNDARVFGTLIGFCAGLRDRDPQGAPCRDALEGSDGSGLLRAVERTGDRLTRVLREVARRSPEARILAVGYPTIVPAADTCPARLPLADGDYAYARTIGVDLNAAVRGAARASGAAYVDVAAASVGHDICSADPWVNGNETTQAAQAFHPFARGQRAVADLVLDRLG